jgi:hypothetical protein
LLLQAASTVPGAQALPADTLDDGVISPEGFDNRASVALLQRLGFERIRIDPGQTQRWRLAHPQIT